MFKAWKRAMVVGWSNLSVSLPLPYLSLPKGKKRKRKTLFFSKTSFAKPRLLLTTPTLYSYKRLYVKIGVCDLF